jgi:hypothetical protein
MSSEVSTRRDILKAAAAAGVLALAGDVVGQATGPATRPAPLIGMQIGAKLLSADNIDQLFDDLHERGINTLFFFAFGYIARWVPMSAEGFHGGNFGIPHMQYYKDTNLTYADLRAPEFGDMDVLDRTTKAARKHGFKTYALIQEADQATAIPNWQPLFEVDSHGRRQGARPGGPCSNNPYYRAFTQGLMEDYARSYDIDGFMWSSERHGGLFSALGAEHYGGTTDPSKATCFCEYCTKKGRDMGINVDRAREGFLALEPFVRSGRSGRRPRDGYFVSLMRLMLNYPELLQWESFWINSRKQFMIDIRNRVRSVNTKLPVGFHVWHNASFSPFYRAEIDFAEMAKNADFIKPVVYNVSAGVRIDSFVDSVSQTIFGDIPRPQILQMLYEMFDYKELPYDKVGPAGFSTDYIKSEVKRTLDDLAGTNVPVYAGLDIDIPGAGAPYTVESVKQSVMTALQAGAHGVIFARNYGEMNTEHVKGVAAALKELGM